MQCDHGRDLIGPYVDDELTGSERQAVALQLQTCAACAAHAEDLRLMSRHLAAAGREPASPQLAARVRSRLAAEAEAAAPMPTPRAFHWASSMARQAATLVVACALTSLATWVAVSSRAGVAQIEAEVVSAHVRSLLQDSPIQVASSDSHTVRPWFTGRIDFAPDVRDLAAQGFPLLGGRVDYAGDRRVGALVYKHNLHIVNVFLWPAASAEPSAAASHSLKGYNTLTWRKAGMVYWAVSDLNIDELQQLQALL